MDHRKRGVSVGGRCSHQDGTQASEQLPGRPPRTCLHEWHAGLALPGNVHGMRHVAFGR